MSVKRTLAIDADTSWLKDFKAQYGSKHLLAFSRGKDALASWLVLREHDIEVVPYHLYLVPGLEFVAESLEYAERIFGAKIIDLPHASFMNMMDDLVYQSPDMIDTINEINPQRVTYADIEREVREITGAHDARMSATGIRAADSMIRRNSFVQHGHVRVSMDGRGTFFPVWNFRKKDVYDIIKRHGVRLPEDYLMFPCSFDGILAQFLEPMKRMRPRDYQRVLDFFPLAEIELYKHGLKNS